MYQCCAKLFAAILAIITLGLFLKFKSQPEYYIVPAFIISKLYCNTLLVILLNRPSTRTAQNDIRLENSRGSSSGRGIDDRNANIQVTIDHEGDGLTMISLPTTMDVSLSSMS